MSYLVLARKYRPSVFGSVSGQDHVTRTLANALKRDRVVHAYLFTGPRGVGKTSVARILSKAINCQSPNDSEPCLKCETCKEISAGTSLAVREIDGASHNSVENVRDLIDSFKSLPSPGYKRKVYIIDEVHMLSISAFNALLKSLEEPPPHTVFILATTDVHKVPETVISRCQRHDFRALSMSAIEARLSEICETERIKADLGALKLIARMADGSMRDAQTLLDRVQSFCSGEITEGETSQALGSIDRGALLELSRHIIGRDTASVIDLTNEIFATGIDPAMVLREFVHFWREVFVAKVGGDNALQGLGVGRDVATELLRLVTSHEVADVQDLWDLAREGAERALRSAQPRYGFEALVVRMATRQPVAEIGSLIGRVLSQGGAKKGAEASVSQTPKASVPSVDPPLEHSIGSVSEAKDPKASSSNTTPSGALVWGELISFANSNTSRMLVENLKRIRPTRCEVGIFEGTGPDFTATNLMREKEKLSQLLDSFLEAQGIAKPRGWKILIQKGQGAHDSGEAKKTQVTATGSRELQGHPAVQSLQKLFPGSKVERVRGKD